MHVDSKAACFTAAFPLCAGVIVPLAFFSLVSISNVRGDELPVLVKCDFDKEASNWQPTDPSAWKIDRKLTSDPVYSQFKKRSNYSPPFRSPYNISLLKTPRVKSFQVDVDVLSTHKDYNHRDACLFFGYQGPSRFYYVHLGKTADPHANQIFIVNKAPRIKISKTTTSGTPWDDQWHHVRIKRNLIEGTIEVFFDDMKKPVMTAEDRNFAWGQVGLGSFDDTTAWNDFVLRGVEVDSRK
ncbi:MAG: hypothetical protein VX768_05135 [Planctomycetota bacterium]|nr:hypothetical protein [Planctomycetota bacterium]